METSWPIQAYLDEIAQLNDDLTACRQALEAAEGREKVLREALQYFAQPMNWTMGHSADFVWTRLPVFAWGGDTRPPWALASKVLNSASPLTAAQPGGERA